MTYSNPQYSNAIGGIVLEKPDGSQVYFKPGSDGHARAESGEWGEVAPYVALQEPPAPSMYADAIEAQVELIRLLDEFAAQFVTNTSSAEMASWAIKEPAAVAYRDSVATVEQSLMIASEAAITGEDPMDLANYIVSRASALREAAPVLAGLRRKYTALIDAVTDPYEYETVLDALAADMATQAASLTQ